MKAVRLAFVLSTLAASAAFAGAALAQANAGLTLSHGDVFSDAVGSVVGVSVRNDGTGAIGSLVVTCAFTAGGKAAGSANTTLYNLLPGSKGSDQVHLMGPRADKATCEISSTTPAPN